MVVVGIGGPAFVVVLVAALVVVLVAALVVVLVAALVVVGACARPLVQRWWPQRSRAYPALKTRE